MVPSRSKFIFSILTALATGVGTAYFVIGVGHLVKNPEVLSAVRNFTFSSLLSSHVLYEALAEEDASHDITFIGESLTAATADSSGASGSAISALAYSVQSLDKDNVLIEKDSERLLPIASVTKLITAVVALKLFDADDTVTITAKVLNTEGSTGKFRLGEKYKIKEILYPLLLVSSNDAAEAIAQAYDAKNGKGKFIKEMNNWVGEVGAYRTYFKDASGLSPQNVSTARDLSIIAKWIKENKPEIFDITLTKAKTIRSHTWMNPTHFLSLSSYTGGKNGYIPEARLTNVSLFELGSPKRLYSVVLLGSKARDKDTLSVLNSAVK
jgi:serine-type D-Ala-D-Ala carboxypeptidase (penicillin-binding protein 5/6)